MYYLVLAKKTLQQSGQWSGQMSVLRTLGCGSGRASQTSAPPSLWVTADRAIQPPAHIQKRELIERTSTPNNAMNGKKQRLASFKCKCPYSHLSIQCQLDSSINVWGHVLCSPALHGSLDGNKCLNERRLHTLCLLLLLDVVLEISIELGGPLMQALKLCTQQS